MLRGFGFRADPMSFIVIWQWSCSHYRQNKIWRDRGLYPDRYRYWAGMIVCRRHRGWINNLWLFISANLCERHCHCPLVWTPPQTLPPEGLVQTQLVHRLHPSIFTTQVNFQYGPVVIFKDPILARVKLVMVCPNANVIICISRLHTKSMQRGEFAPCDA